MTAALVRPQIEIGISGFSGVLDRHLSICCNRQTARIIKASTHLQTSLTIQATASWVSWRARTSWHCTTRACAT